MVHRQLPLEHQPHVFLDLHEAVLEALKRLQLPRHVTGEGANGGILDIAEQVLNT